MSDTTAVESVEVAEPPKLGGPLGLVRDAATEEGWLFVAGGITIAGGAYPVTVAMGLITIGLWFTVFAMLAEPSMSVGYTGVFLLSAVGAGVFYALVLATVGVIWAGFFSVIVVPVFYLFARSLQLRANIIWLGAICGGLVGFLAVLPIWLQFPFVENPGSAFLVATLVGPCLATIVGQLGGAWGGWRAWRDQPPAIFADPTAKAEREPLMRFQIRHLLWITVWVALMLTAIRFSGIAFELILPVLLGWLVYQAATLYVGSRLAYRVGPAWFPRKARRST